MRCVGVVHNVVFPTGIDPRIRKPFLTIFTTGMADSRIGRARLQLAEPAGCRRARAGAAREPAA